MDESTASKVGTVRVEALVSGTTVDQLRDWASLWSDLLHVGQVLHTLDLTPANLDNVFTRRALWESAVIAYGRMATKRGRKVRFVELLATLGDDAVQCHKRVMKWRDRHIAHRQDPSRETISTHAVIAPELRRMLSIRIRVAPAIGPEQDGEALIPLFQQHVFALRNIIWEQRLGKIGAQVIAEYATKVDQLLQDATEQPWTPTIDSFMVTIDLPM